MTLEQRMKNLTVPAGKIDVILDTDAYNEIDDQFAIAYLLRSKEKLNPVAMYAAPFHNANSNGPEDGMEKSYDELQKILALAGEEGIPTFRGSRTYLPDEKTPVPSDAASDLAERANRYSPEHPLYVVAIGAITNVASAILLNPAVKENTVVVWLGGHGLEWADCREFNLFQDVAAARVVMGCGVPFVQLPCQGVVSAFTISKPELEYWFKGTTELGDYLAQNTISAAEKYAKGRFWSRVIWDVTAVAWLLNEEDRFLRTRLVPTHLPSYANHYESWPDAHWMNYVYSVKRDALWNDVIEKITGIKMPR